MSNKERLEEIFGKGFDKLVKGRRSYSMVPKIQTPQTPIGGHPEPEPRTVRASRPTRQTNSLQLDATQRMEEGRQNRSTVGDLQLEAMREQANRLRWGVNTPLASQVEAVVEATPPEVAEEPVLTREEVQAQVENLQRFTDMYERSRAATRVETRATTAGSTWTVTATDVSAPLGSLGFTYRVVTNEEVQRMTEGGDELLHEPV
jgi:hypothetical protein